MRKNIGIAALFTWIGFVAAISFMEAWLKFRAPGVTLPIGLGIGRLVFAALNKIEWILLLGIIFSLFPFKKIVKSVRITLITACAILITQTIWLLPQLDARAELYITGSPVMPSNLHLYYVVAEGIKMISLFFLGISLFRKH
ncbi:hypothetical protein [Pedobacter insulae]|uniref:DUF4149 domain-containing protein n=1 Tax=Pedobacter insulae TaxID=414048 RepID=A0A1I3A1A0_9SPHI|nr:hypothetical protein [Pedobacter insulae]SFH43887.1 hypothetical protein SAMN04489864_11295 [Pedobacter insulae]